MNDLKRHVPLYLKHRPQTLEQLVGQTAVFTTLSNAINHDRISHAYLFTGPRGTGKTSSARILAKSLNCKAGDKATVTPCLECTSCIEIKSCSSPGVIEIDAASNNSVDDARVLIERAPLVAPGARYKIYIIDECHMLTKEAFNALLKTIEDPPPNVVFILATTEEHKVLPTIVSRCQRLMFRLVTQSDLLVHLKSVAEQESIEITDLAVDFVARRSGGGMRDALGLLDQASLLSSPGQPVDVKDLLNLLGALQEDVLLEMSEHILNRKGHELLQAAGKLLRDGREPTIVLQELARHFLNLAKSSYLAGMSDAREVAGTLIVGSPDYLDGLLEVAPKFERSELTQIVEALDELEQTCRRTTQPAMHLEVGLLALCHRQDMLLIRELADRVEKLEKGAPPAVARPTSAPVATQPARPAYTPAPAAPAASYSQAPATLAAGSYNSPPATTSYNPAPAQPAPAQSAPASAAPAASYAPSSSPAYIPSPAAAAAPSYPASPSPTPAAASPSPTPAAAAPQAAPPTAPISRSDDDDADENSASADEVDRVWSATMDELSRRNIPAFSIVSQHAFPLALNERDFVIGVKENLLKSVESKAEHLKAACYAAIGKQINVKLKPQAMQSAPPPAAPSRPAPAAREEYTPAPQPVAAAASGGSQSASDDYDDEPDLAPRVKIDDLAGGSPPPASMTAPDSAPDTTGGANGAPAPGTQLDRGHDSALIKEAYRLFEGPGSRQIG